MIYELNELKVYFFLNKINSILIIASAHCSSVYNLAIFSSV